MGRNWLLPGALRHSGDGQAGGDSVPPCTNHGTLINSGAAHASFPDLKCSRAQAVKLLSHWCVVELKTPHSWEIVLPAPQFLPWEPVTCFEEAFSTLRHAQKQGITFFLNFFFLPENTPYFFHLLPNLPTERLAQERSVSLAAVPSALCCSRLPQTHRKGIFDTLWANGATSGTEIIVQLGPKAALPEFSRFLKDKKLLVRGINTSLPELQVKQAYLRLRS